MTLANPVDFERDYPILEQIDDLANGLWYINIHSTPDFAAGEIRGQVIPAPEPSGGLVAAAALLALAALRRNRRGAC